MSQTTSQDSHPPHDEERVTTHAGQETEHSESELPSLAELMRTMLEDHKLREAEVAEDHRQRELETQECMREMREQIQTLRRLVSDRAPAATRTSSDSEGAKLTRLSDRDDIEAYLLTFERMMEAYEVNRARWVYKLAPQLTGKAQQAYAALPADEAKDYDKLKAAILRRFNINEETYRRRFKFAKLKTGETPRELVTRLRDLASKWGRDCLTVQDVFDIMIKQQLMSCLPEDARVWVSERKPKTSEEAGGLADDYMQARETRKMEESLQTDGPPRTRRDRCSGPPPGNCPRCGPPGHWARDCPNPKEGGEGTGHGDEPGETGGSTLQL